MQRRAAWALIGLLIFCCLALVSSAVYPFSLSEPHAANPPDEQFTASESDSYRATGRIVVDGRVKLAFEAVETTADERYLMVQEPGIRSERYQASPNAAVYERLSVAHDTAEQLRADIRADDDRHVLWENRTAERVTLITRANTTDLSSSLGGPASVVISSLHVTSYRTATENDTANLRVYEPRNGWYDGTEPYRITAATGTIRTGADPYAVESATVRWTITTPAGSYAAYALGRLVGTDPRTHTISYEFDDETPALTHPAWANDTWNGT